MDINHLGELLRGLPFRQAVWLFPLATALRFFEETPHFCRRGTQVRVAWPDGSTVAADPWTRNGVCGCLLCGLASMFSEDTVLWPSSSLPFAFTRVS